MALEFLSALLKKVIPFNFNEFLINIIFSVIILLIGVIAGKLVKFIFKKAIEKAEIQKEVRTSFIKLFLTTIKWSIYIIFLNLALIQLKIPEFTSWITSILVIIPALVGALILIGIGFAIAVYLKEIIKESQIQGHKILSEILFSFVLYVFIIFAIKTALISQDKSTVNIIILILTAVVSTSVAFWYVIKEKKSIDKPNIKPLKK